MAISKSKQKKLIKYAKKVRPLTWILAILFLAVGVGGGYLAVSQVCKNDCIEVVGQKEIVYTVGAGTTPYTDEGIKVILFGKDCSENVTVESNMDLVNGEYQIDLSEEYDYFIKYTIKHFKVGTVIKYRTITVEEVQP